MDVSLCSLIIVTFPQMLDSLRLSEDELRLYPDCSAVAVLAHLSLMTIARRWIISAPFTNDTSVVKED